MNTRAQRRELFQAVDVYPVLTPAFCNGRPLAEVCRQVLAGGARVVQLREKTLPKRALLSLAAELRELTAAAGALFIVNDHLDLALAVEADGLHLGQEDLPLPAARRLAPELLLGASTHSLEEARRAEAEAADYVNIGPVFSTQTKSLAMAALGPEAIPRISAGISIPFTVMGGIHRDNLGEVLARGARRIAMVTEITQAPDIAGRVRELRQTILSFPRPACA